MLKLTRKTYYSNLGNQFLKCGNWNIGHSPGVQQIVIEGHKELFSKKIKKNEILKNEDESDII